MSKAAAITRVCDCPSRKIAYLQQCHTSKKMPNNYTFPAGLLNSYLQTAKCLARIFQKNTLAKKQLEAKKPTQTSVS
jgi:hypothetical protein